MTELGHRACLDLADPLTREVEVLAHLFQGAGLAAVETEPQAQDLALALVERGEQPADLVGQEGDGGDLEGRFGGAVLDHVAELGVAYATLQCVELLEGGAPGIHFYTLNKSPATRAVVSALYAARLRRS